MARLAFVALAAAGILAACGPAPTGQPGPTASSTPARGQASALPPFISTGGSGGHACAAADLNAVVAPAPSASGGQEGAQLAFGNQGGAGCVLRGTPIVQLLDASGRQIPITNDGVTSASPAVVLIPGHVALDAAHPQIGEAQLLLGWHTGDVQPGTCTKLVTPAKVVRITFPGGGAVEARAYFLEVPIAPCTG